MDISSQHRQPGCLWSPTVHTHPYPYLSFERTLTPSHCSGLEQLFTQTDGWSARDGAFYQCSLRDITHSVPLELRGALQLRLADLMGQPLTHRVEVTAQRMDPGQQVGVHTDAPRLGYEAVRLVLQLARGWQPEHGGVFQVWRSEDGPVVSEWPPLHNHAIAFALHAESHHAVTQVTERRRCLVFNFWHVGNTERAEQLVSSLVQPLHFSALRGCLHPIMFAAEGT